MTLDIIISPSGKLYDNALSINPYADSGNRCHNPIVKTFTDFPCDYCPIEPSCTGLPLLREIADANYPNDVSLKSLHPELFI